MTFNWIEKELDQIIIKRNQGVNTTTEKVKYSDKGIRVIRANNISQNHIDYSDCVYVDAKTFSKIKSSCKPNRGDVLYTNIGSQFGNAAQVNVDFDFAIAWNVLRIQPKKNIDSDFLVYLLNNPTNRSYIRSLNSSSTMPFVSGTNIGAIKFLIPEFSVQRDIGKWLKLLDDKIKNNYLMNETLEQMARAIFKSWFVDFDPVHAKTTGNAPAHMDDETAALFPSSFGDDGLPVGWYSKSLDQIADFLNGAAMQKFPAEGDQFLPVIKIAELRNGISSNTNRATPDVPKKYLVSDGDVLFAWSGSLMQKVWTEGTGALNQHLFKVTSERYQKWFFYYWIDHHMEWFQSIAASKATTMGHIQRSHLSEAKVCVPDSLLLDSASANIAPLLEKQIQNSLENKTLAKIRDTLLPKLISGKIRVKDAEREVEAAI